MAIKDDIHFNAGNPLLLFQAAADAALKPTPDELREYPSDPSRYWSAKFSDLAVPRFLEEMGICAPDEMHGKNLIDTMTFAYGVLHATTLTTDYLTYLVGRLNKARQDRGMHPLKPAIVTSVPAYTFPLNHMQKRDITLFKMSRTPTNNWAVKPDDLSETLEEIRKGGEYIAIGYYDSNPNNPTGHIRTRDETRALAEVFDHHNQEMHALDEVMHCGRSAGATPANRKMTHRLTIMDDMIYMGLEHASKTPASFISQPETANDTVVFLGVSKYGMPGIRGGLIVTHPMRRPALFREFWESAGYAPAPSLIAVAETFSGDSHRFMAREEHLTKLNEAHWHGFQLFRSLVNGTDNQFLGSYDGKRVFADVVRAVGDAEKASTWLREGIPGLSVHEPESGFFTMLNAEGLRGSFMPHGVDGISQRRAGHGIGSVSMLHSLFKAFGAEYLRGDTCGTSHTNLWERASFALPPRDIIKGLSATRKAVKSLTFKTPLRRATA